LRHRRLGGSGLALSEISLGSYQTFGTTLDLEQSRRCIHRALELGINAFDTADGYGDGEGERILGRVLRDFDRGDWIIATKCFFPRSGVPTNRGLSRKHVIESVDRSLRNLGIDHIDLMQCHRFDAETPLEETIDAMNLLIQRGKVLYWGIGRFDAAQIGAAVRTAGEVGARRPVSHQTVYSLLNRSVEGEILDAADRHGLGTLVYGALCQGVLTGKYAVGAIPEDSRAARPSQRDGMYDLTADGVRRAGRLGALAAQAGLTPAQLSIAWCLRQRAVTSVIIGASRPEQLEDNVGASGVLLSADLLAAIEAALAAPVDETVADPRS